MVFNVESEGLEVGSKEILVIVKELLCRCIRRRIELKGDEKGGGGCFRDGI